MVNKLFIQGRVFPGGLGDIWVGLGPLGSHMIAGIGTLPTKIRSITCLAGEFAGRYQYQ